MFDWKFQPIRAKVQGTRSYVFNLFSDEQILQGVITSKIPQLVHFFTADAVSFTLSAKGSMSSCLFLIKYNAILCAERWPIPGNLEMRLINFWSSSWDNLKWHLHTWWKGYSSSNFLHFFSWHFFDFFFSLIQCCFDQIF